jgi:hypothetical protein
MSPVQLAEQAVDVNLMVPDFSNKFALLLPQAR